MLTDEEILHGWSDRNPELPIELAGDFIDGARWAESRLKDKIAKLQEQLDLRVEQLGLHQLKADYDALLLDSLTALQVCGSLGDEYEAIMAANRIRTRAKGEAK